jgi:protein-S-isoprenylcysteine O-methyltransferase Ste14
MRNPTEILIKYRALIGIVSVVVVLLLAIPSPRSIVIGFFFMMLGMFFRAWSSGYIDKDRELATEGPYSLTRNPLYFGNLLLGIGIAVASNQRTAALICAGYYLFFFTFLIVVERSRLRKRFGARYDEWARQANLFFPKIKKVRSFNFNIAFYMKNREYRVLFYSLLIIAVFVVKYLKRIGFIGGIGK